MNSSRGRVVQGQAGGTSFCIPSRIGLGALDYKSIRQIFPEDHKGESDLIARYTTKEGDPIYQIRIGARSCHVEEFFESEKIETTEGETIEAVFQRKFDCFQDNPRFLRVKDRMSKGRNISFVPPDKLTRCAEFPAGLVFILRIPVFGRGRLLQIDQDLISLGSRFPHLVICGGEIISATRNQFFHLFSDFVEFYVLLWELEELVTLIFEMGIVEPGRPPEFGLHVLDRISASPGSMNVGIREEGIQRTVYAHWLNRPGDYDLAVVEQSLMRALFEGREGLDGRQNLPN